MLAARRLYHLKSHFLQINKAAVSTSTAQIKFSKDDVLVDEKVKIEVKGLDKGQKVTLQTYFVEGGKSYGACAHYVADQEGTVDTHRDPSLGGTYNGQNPMGLFTSVMATPGVKPGRLIKADVMTPYKVTVAVQEGFREFKDLPWSDQLPCVTSSVLLRSYTAPGVRRIPVRENGIYGTLFLPPGEGPFPGVIDMFGLDCAGIIEFRSSLLASHGIASFAVCYVGPPSVPKTLDELDLNYFLTAFDWLASNSLIDPKRLGGVGTCIGGGFVTLIASRRPAIRCFVTVNGSLKPFGKKSTVEGRAVNPALVTYDRVKKVDNDVAFRDMFLEADNSWVEETQGWINGAKVLAIHGLDDQCVHPRLMDVLEDGLPGEVRGNYTFIRYPGAGHVLEIPYAPVCGSSYNSVLKLNMIFGGSYEEHSSAQEDSWPKILEFLNINLQ